MVAEYHRQAIEANEGAGASGTSGSTGPGAAVVAIGASVAAALARDGYDVAVGFGQVPVEQQQLVPRQLPQLERGGQGGRGVDAVFGRHHAELFAVRADHAMAGHDDRQRIASVRRADRTHRASAGARRWRRERCRPWLRPRSGSMRPSSAWGIARERSEAVRLAQRDMEDLRAYVDLPAYDAMLDYPIRHVLVRH